MKKNTIRHSIKIFVFVLTLLVCACSVRKQVHFISPSSPRSTEADGSTVTSSKEVLVSSPEPMLSNKNEAKDSSSPKSNPPISSSAKPGLGSSLSPTEKALEWSRAYAEFESSERIFKAAGNDCIALCKALASMVRATEHLCALASEGSESDRKKCTEAQTRTAQATEKVKSMCGVCSN